MVSRWSVGVCALVMGLAGAAQAGSLPNVPGHEVGFGTTIYPFRKNQDVHWLLSESRALGLTELRVEYSRERVERSADESNFRPGDYRERQPEVLDALRHSGFELIFTLDGHRSDARGHRVDFPRNADGSVDGRAAAQGFVHFARWVVGETRDFVGAYELWNEAFGLVSFGGKKNGEQGFGPGGSKENADNYAGMFLPVAKRIRSLAPRARLLIEGNYWNLERSVKASPDYLALLAMADGAVLHPYGYKQKFYEPAGHIRQAIDAYTQLNPRLGIWYTEYGVHPHDAGLPGKDWTAVGQARAVLRATALHLAHGVRHLDVFDLYYPNSPPFTLIAGAPGGPRTRRLAFDALARFLGSVTPHRADSGLVVERADLPAPFQDLAVSTPRGATYMVWQESEPATFDTGVPARPVRVSLSLRGGGAPRLARVLDPVTGKVVKPRQASVRGTALELELDVPDYPLLVELTR